MISAAYEREEESPISVIKRLRSLILDEVGELKNALNVVPKSKLDPSARKMGSKSKKNDDVIQFLSNIMQIDNPKNNTRIKIGDLIPYHTLCYQICASLLAEKINNNEELTSTVGKENRSSTTYIEDDEQTSGTAKLGSKTTKNTADANNTGNDQRLDTVRDIERYKELLAKFIYRFGSDEDEFIRECRTLSLGLRDKLIEYIYVELKDLLQGITALLAANPDLLKNLSQLLEPLIIIEKRHSQDNSKIFNKITLALEKRREKLMETFLSKWKRKNFKEAALVDAVLLYWAEHGSGIIDAINEPSLLLFSYPRRSYFVRRSVIKEIKKYCAHIVLPENDAELTREGSFAHNGLIYGTEAKGVVKIADGDMIFAKESLCQSKSEKICDKLCAKIDQDPRLLHQLTSLINHYAVSRAIIQTLYYILKNEKFKAVIICDSRLEKYQRKFLESINKYTVRNPQDELQASTFTKSEPRTKKNKVKTTHKCATCQKSRKFDGLIGFRNFTYYEPSKDGGKDIRVCIEYRKCTERFAIEFLKRLSSEDVVMSALSNLQTTPI